MKDNDEQTDVMIALLKSVKFKEENFTRREEVWIAIRRYIEADRIKCKYTISYPIRYVAVAVILIGMTLSAWFWCDVRTFTDDNSVAIVLPDGSDVTLHARSRLKYNRLAWLLKRQVKLDGTAVFSGVHDARFSVHTAMGNIRVLGTRFLVDQVEGKLTVECYEGTIAVATHNEEEILNEDERLEYFNNTISKSRIWPEYLYFDNIPLSEVLSKMEEVYGISFDVSADSATIRFSGSMTTGNLEEALIVICGCCNLDYRLRDDRIEIL